MKNKIKLTVTADSYRLRMVLEGHTYERHMKRKRRGEYTELDSPHTNIDLLGDIDEEFEDVANDILDNAFDAANLLDVFEEMEE